MRNQFDIIGNLGHLHAINEKVIKADIAVNYSYKKKDSEVWEKKTDWVTVTLFDKQAERIQTYPIGSLIAIQGKVKNTQYEKDDQKIYAISLTASKLSLLHRKEIEENGTADKTISDSKESTNDNNSTPKSEAESTVL